MLYNMFFTICTNLWHCVCKDNIFLSGFIPELLGIEYGFLYLSLQHNCTYISFGYSCGTTKTTLHHHDTYIALHFSIAPH